MGGGVPDGRKEDDIVKIKKEGYKIWEEKRKDLVEKKFVVPETGVP
ncbi:12265_t:CDS:1, partial [Acaulospora colombiana]